MSFGSFLRGIGAQLNPFDRGRTYSSIQDEERRRREAQQLLQNTRSAQILKVDQPRPQPKVTVEQPPPQPGIRIRVTDALGQPRPTITPPPAPAIRTAPIISAEEVRRNTAANQNVFKQLGQAIAGAPVEGARLAIRPVAGGLKSAFEQGERQSGTAVTQAVDDLRKLDFESRRRALQDPGLKLVMQRRGLDINNPTDQNLDAIVGNIPRPQPYVPTGAAAKVLGKEPIESYQTRAEGYKQAVGESRFRAGATPLAIAGAGATIVGDFVPLPIGKGAKVSVKALQKAKTAEEVSKLVGKNLSDDAIQVISSTADDKLIRSILEAETKARLTKPKIGQEQTSTTNIAIPDSRNFKGLEPDVLKQWANTHNVDLSQVDQQIKDGQLKYDKFFDAYFENRPLQISKSKTEVSENISPENLKLLKNIKEEGGYKRYIVDKKTGQKLVDVTTSPAWERDILKNGLAPDLIHKNLTKSVLETETKGTPLLRPSVSPEITSPSVRGGVKAVGKGSGEPPLVNTLQDLSPEAKTQLDDVAKQLGFKNHEDMVRTVEQPKAVSNIDEVTPKPLQNIDPNDPFGTSTRRGEIRAGLGKLVDDDAPMLRLMRKIENETGQKGLADQFMFDTGNVRVSRAIANQKLKNSPEIGEAFGGLSKRELKELDDYAAARAELKNYDGMKTSRSMEDLQKTVSQLEGKYGARFEAQNQFWKGMAQYLHKNGLISRETLDNYLANDDYIRIQRDMDDLVGGRFGTSQARSLGTTTATQKRTGSERAVLPPSQSLPKRVQELELQVQRNKAASNTLDVLREAGLAKQVKDTKNKNTISRLVDGKREIYEVPGDIKQVMDNVNPYQLGIIAKIVSAPVRAFRAGTTALAAPFTAVNYLRDQASSAIYSKSVLNTHNPKNIITGLASAARDFAGESQSPLWKKFEEFTGDQTIYDELRNVQNTKRLLREIRRGKAGKYGNMATEPIRTLENLNSITERATRFQNFKGIYKKTLKETGSEDEAIKQAVLAARQNSVDFARSSSFTRVANLFIPYFNASVQGSRNVARSFRDRPLATSMKSVGLVAMPAIAATTWNYADKDRRAAYESINDYEKEDNFIIVGPNPKQREDGTWEGVIKIPKPQGYRELTDPARDVTEAFLKGEAPENVGKMFKDMMGGLTGPVDITDKRKFVGSFIPQQGKPLIQANMNKDLYTGNDIVPGFMTEQTDDPTKQAYEDTSGTARIIANQLGVSPLKVEKFITDTAGSLGRYGVNASDTALAKTGRIPMNQIGGRSIARDFSRRLFEASGKILEKNKSEGRKYYDDQKVALETVGLNKNERSAFDSVFPSRKDFLGNEMSGKTYYDGADKAITFQRYPKVFETAKEIDRLQRERGKPGDPLYGLNPDQRNIVLQIGALGASPGNREAAAILKLNPWLKDYYKQRSDYFDQIKTTQTPEEQAKSGVDPKGMKIPVASPNLQAKLDTLNSLKDKAQRAQFYSDNPDVLDFFTERDDYERGKRAFMGLPMFDPYPKPAADVQKYLDSYSKLPKGNGPLKRDGTPSSPDRSAWIKSHPNEWSKMTDYFNIKAQYDLAQSGSLAVYENIGFNEDDYKDILSLGGGGGGFRFGGGGGGSPMPASDISNFIAQLKGLPFGDVPKLKIRAPQVTSKVPSSAPKRLNISSLTLPSRVPKVSKRG